MNKVEGGTYAGFCGSTVRGMAFNMFPLETQS